MQHSYCTVFCCGHPTVFIQTFEGFMGFDVVKSKASQFFLLPFLHSQITMVKTSFFLQLSPRLRFVSPLTIYNTDIGIFESSSLGPYKDYGLLSILYRLWKHPELYYCRDFQLSWFVFRQPLSRQSQAQALPSHRRCWPPCSGQLVWMNYFFLSKLIRKLILKKYKT